MKNVKDGYYMNYLFPRKLAETATPERLKAADKYRKVELVQQERIKEQASGLKEKFDKLKVVLKAKAKGDKLYGSITESEILKAIEEKINVRLDKQNLLLSEHIKVVGTYEVPVKLAEGVEAKFILEVKPEK